MKHRTFDPRSGNADSILVASFDGSLRDEAVKRDYEAELREIENDRREKDLRSLMHQRHSFAG